MVDFKQQELINSLRRNYGQFSKDAIDALMKVGKVVHANSGTTIIKQGDQTKEVYFLLFGRISVEIENEFGEEIVLNEIGNGEFFGEMALITGEPRTTTLITTKDSSLLRIEGADFEELLETNPSILKHLGSTLINRLRKANLSKNENSFQNICFIPLETENRSSQFLNSLQEKLEGNSSFFVVSKQSAKAANVINEQEGYSSKGISFKNWVRDLEVKYSYLLFICNDGDLEWSELCLRQADRIMFIGTGRLSPSLTKIEELLTDKNIASKIEKNILLCQDEKQPVKGTAKLLQNRKVKNIFHVSNEKDIDRVIRYVQGKSIKLVLGGGGAKGFAHLGVYKAMLELGIPVDFVGGTSAGALMGSGIALGWDYDKIVDSVHQAMVKDNPLNDFQFPMVSFLKGNKLDKTIQKYFGEFQIEDLAIPFYAVAANFTKSQIEILDKGALGLALRASISLPTILPPVVKDNDLLFDGGIIDNLPYDNMDSLAQGPVIGVDLSITKHRELGYEKVPGNRTLMKQKITGKRKYKVPNINQIMMGTMILASNDRRKRNEKKFDIYIKPDVSKFGFMKWANFDKIIESGYDAAYPILQEWKKNNQEDLSK